MASWIDQVNGARFRGVPFLVEKPAVKGGRRVANHQYPKRDKPYAEDLGRKQKTFTFEAFVVGDTAFAQRNALVAALDQEGPGTLIHPTWGMMRAQVTEWTESESLVAEMRICRFQLSFVEAGDIAAPTVSADTTAQAATAADTATTANQSYASANWGGPK